MKSYFVACMLLTTHIGAAFSIFREFTRDADNRRTDVTDYKTRDRMKRMVKIISAAIFEGMRAAKTLSKGAKEKFFGPNGRIYEKSGGFARAEKDFDSVKPRKVEGDEDLQAGKRGEVGDREITLKRNGWLGNPTVYLIKNHKGPFRAGEIDTVVYVD